jgi:DNA repair exonuclease SbcCD ATPase subunit
VVKEVIVEKRVEIPVEVIKEVVKIEYVDVPVDRVVEKIVEITKEVPVDRVVEKIVEVIKEVPVEKVVIKEVIKEIPIETVVTKTEYVSDNTQTNELLLKIQQLESDKQLFSTKTQELEGQVQKFSTKTTEMENIFQDKMSKKEQELDRLRQELDKQLDIPPVEKIVEVVVEKEITDNSLKSKLDALQNTLSKVRQETLEKDKKIRELEQTIQEIQKFQDNKQAVYLKGSNLDDKLYK